MPLPVPNLDDRRFDDLVIEAQERLRAQLPELTQIAPGDPVHSFIDLFAWLTETILYRANLIPERQRRVFLNLLQLPVRAARPARGLVCIDAGPRAVSLAALVPDGTQLKARQQTFSTIGEVQPTHLQLYVLMKEVVDTETLQELGFTEEHLREQYPIKSNEKPAAYRPRVFVLGKDTLSLAYSLAPKAYYLAFAVPRILEDDIEEVKKTLAGITLNIAIAPADELPGEAAGEVPKRELAWELMYKGETDDVSFLPLEVVDDSSEGGRRMGVVRLRMPRNPSLFTNLSDEQDPMFVGMGNFPPDLSPQVPSSRIAFWVRLRSGDEPDLPLGYLGVNGVDIVAQGVKRNLIIGIGTGEPDQAADLPDTNIDPDAIELDVQEGDAWQRWEPVDYLFGQPPNKRVYRLEAAAGHVYFGDGLNGRRPPEGRPYRIAFYRYGGGAAGNLEAGEIKELSDASARLVVRHEWPCQGGIDAETVDDAERRIPEFLTHRDRAVTKEDFRILCESNPVNAVARAEVMEGFLPGASIQAVREDVPGVVSIFVLPPGGPPVLGQIAKPTKGLLKDVFEYLLARVLIGTEIYVLSPEFVPLAVGVKVDVRDPRTEKQTLRSVREAIIAYLWPLTPGGAQEQGWPMGESVRSNELMTQVARVEGVQAVNAVSLFAREPQGWRRLNENETLELKRYQLPELLGVTATPGSGDPEFPSGIGPLAGALPGAPGAGVPGAAGEAEVQEVPTPVIPPLMPDEC